MVEAARVYALIAANETCATRMISTGGLKNRRLNVRTAAELMRDELVAMGVPASAILVESASRNTYEEAVNVASILRDLGTSQVVLSRKPMDDRRRVPNSGPSPIARLRQIQIAVDVGARICGTPLPSARMVSGPPAVCHSKLRRLAWKERESKPGRSRVFGKDLIAVARVLIRVFKKRFVPNARTLGSHPPDERPAGAAIGRVVQRNEDLGLTNGRISPLVTEKLRPFVELRVPQPFADAGDARIAARRQRRALLRVCAHRAKLEHVNGRPFGRPPCSEQIAPGESI